MKRLRLRAWSGQLLAARPGAPPLAGAPSRCFRPDRLQRPAIRHQSGFAAPNVVFEDSLDAGTAPPSSADEGGATAGAWTRSLDFRSSSQPSPPPDRAARSAKLAALHARLALSDRIPRQALARTLVDRTADASAGFNNSSLAYVGYTLISYHVSEWLMCRYPRLPMAIMFEAMRAYAGESSLHHVARDWGVESAAAPGDEVDPGLLQFRITPYRPVLTTWGFQRPEREHKFRHRQGISSRVVLDDDFGDRVPLPSAADGDFPAYDDPESQAALAALDPVAKRAFADGVHADFVRAVVGAVFAHCGRDEAKAFIAAHVLSRRLDFERLFRFRMPTRELAFLCARENFDPPVARLLSETGRLSRTPVFVVGIYSGKDKIGEGASWSLDAARTKAAVNSLKAWYLYSPGENVRVPSDTLADGAKPWEPAYVDMGEIL